MALKLVTASLVWMSAATFGQSAVDLPAFEVTSVKPAPPSDPNHIHTRMSTDNARLSYTNVSVKEVLEQAYAVQDYQVTGPDWMGLERFDINAKIPDGAPRSQVPLMLQALLADRFKMALHRDTKDLPVYVLTTGKNGPKLKKAESSTGTDSNSNGTRSHLSATISMTDLAMYLSRQLRRPVLDQTGLSGVYEFTLDWTPDTAADTLDASGGSLFTAVQEQLGLKLETRRAPLETIVVDHVERPSEN